VEGEGKVSPSKFAGVTINPGDRVWLYNGGGGGWGDPRKRDRAKIEQDIREGWVTRERAERDYGTAPAPKKNAAE